MYGKLRNGNYRAIHCNALFSRRFAMCRRGPGAPGSLFSQDERLHRTENPQMPCPEKERLMKQHREASRALFFHCGAAKRCSIVFRQASGFDETLERCLR